MNRDRAVAIARACAKAKPPSYYVEPFEPHPWVVDAIELVGADLDQVAAERDALKTRQAELLATIVKVTNQTPYPEELQGWTDQRAKLIAEVGTVRAELVEARNDLIAALPSENERQILRWMREQLQAADELVQGDVRYVAALELLQRFLTMKVNHAA